MKFCPKCGHNLRSTDTICPQCGYNLPAITKSSNVKRAAISITIAAALVALYLGLNIYAISNLQFRGHQTGSFDFADMSADVQLEACNPSFFPASFNKLNVDIIYKSTNFGTFTVWGKTILPHSSSIVDGRLKVNAEAVAGLFIASLSSAFSGKTTFDVNQMRLVASLDAPILGVIPFSVTKEYTISEFTSLMNGQAAHFNC